MTSILPWLVGTKHFTESKTLPKIQKHVPEEDEFWILERVFGFWNVFLDFGTCFWILGRVFGFWNVFLDSGTCFCILERVFGFWNVFLDSGKCFVPTSHGNTI